MKECKKNPSKRQLKKGPCYIKKEVNAQSQKGEPNRKKKQLNFPHFSK